MENEKIYDIILQNNASNETFLYSGLEDTSKSGLYHEFDVEIDAPEGEYTYVLLKNTRDDVAYDFRTPILETNVHTDDGDFVLSDFQPATGLMRIGNKVEPANIYDEEPKNNNNTIFYYE